jgi:hypothetical protein
MVSMQRGGGGEQGGAPPMASDPTPFEQIVDKLKIDEKKQLPDVQRMFSAVATEAQPIERELMRARLRMVQVADNPAELKAATEAFAAAEAKMVAIEVKAFRELQAMLKPNQLSKSVEAFGLMAGLFNPPTPRTGGPMRRGGGISLNIAPGIGSAASFQRGGGGGMRGGGMPGGFSAPSRLNSFTLMFSLSEDQKKAVKKILDDEFKAAAGLRAALSSAREPIGVAIRDNQEAAIPGAIAAYAAAAADMATAEMKALAHVVSAISASNAPEASTVQTSVYMMRGAFSGKKWDTAPDLRFY